MNGWYTFSFKVNCPPNEEPKWWVDIFILDTIVRGILKDEQARISVWRIHRRALRDDHGHEFTFECLTDGDTAKVIGGNIENNRMYRLLTQAGLSEKYRLRGPTASPDGLSNQEWPDELKKAWPHYIYGASVMLLEFAGALKGRIDGFKDFTACEADINQVGNLYTALHQELTRLWHYYGNHAFFHHLNALFACRPILISPTIHNIVASF